MAIVKLLSSNQSVPSQLIISDQSSHKGGEGNVYITPDKNFVVKIYHKATSEKQLLLKQILDLGANLGDDAQYLAWPLAIVTHRDKEPCVGVVTRYVPFTSLHKLIFNATDAAKQFEAGRSWLEYVKMARGVAAALRTLHGKGMAHADVHFKNFLADPQTGEITLIDLDGLVVSGFLPPQVKGMPIFMAPEVTMGMAKPNEMTDRHSTAVLILWILLLRNVMQPQICYDEEDASHDDILAYGREACFSENPHDLRNRIPRIGTPLYHRGVLSYSILTPKLQDLTRRALVEGLHNPTKRPQVAEWERALAEAYDALIVCPTCRQSYFYQYWLQPLLKRKCPFCGTPPRPPYPKVLEVMEDRGKGQFVTVRHLILYNGMPIFKDVIEKGRIPPFTRRSIPHVGMTSLSIGDDAYNLTNTGNEPWRILNGSSATVAKNDSVALQKGMWLSFGPSSRLLNVVE